MKRNFYLAGAVLMLIALWSRGALAAQADAWKADWEKSVEAAKKEGQLTLYGSPDFEGLFGEFHKKYPEIKITGVFNRGADVAKRLMAERRADKYLADLIRQRHDDRLQCFLQSESARSDSTAARAS